MANEENLKPFPKNPRTREEQERLARKAGIASGIARRKKGASRKYLKQLLALTPNLTKADEARLRNLGVPEGVELDNEFLITLAMMKKAKDGDLRAIDMVHEYLGEDPHTMLEEKRLKVQQSAVEAMKNSDGLIVALGGAAGEVFEDGGDTPDALEDTE